MMNSTPLELGAPDRWPGDIQAYLGENYDFILGWERRRAWATTQHYERFVSGLRDLLRQYSVVGWHCTRLTKNEIANIRLGGMQTLDTYGLEKRLDAAVADGLLTETLGARLKIRHQAHEDSRAGRIWFCLYPPRLVGEHDIEWFFRRWGGEALYNSHEDDPEVSEALRTTGTPCVIEVLVPLTDIPSLGSLVDSFARRYLSAQGHRASEKALHNGAVARSLGGENIIEIWRFPTPRFAELTGCEAWETPIQG